MHRDDASQEPSGTPRLADAPLEGPQLEALRRLSPAERYRASRALYWTLRRHKAAFLRSLHPDWDEARVEAEVRRIFLHARS